VREVAARMGLVQPAERSILVGGTNGKGSTVAFLESIARAAGLRTATYTSPHLLRYNERVRIDGHDVDDAPLVDAFEAVEAARGDTPLTYFEYGTLAALWLFQRERLDLAILEVGLGGRLDAVNLVDADVAVITTVDLDHQDWLGNDREVIGAEKAGIARAWKPLVLGEDDPPSSVLGRAYRIGASAVRANCDFFFAPNDDGETWHWREVNFGLDLPMPALAAPVQLRNAATAIAALRALDIPMTREAIAQGIADAHVAGRLQRFARDGVEIVVDVRTQPAGGTRAVRVAGGLAGRGPHVRRVRRARRQGRGRRRGGARRPHRRLAPRRPGGDRSTPASPPPPSPIACAERPPAAVRRIRRSRDALAAARSTAEPGDRILVFGSFHTVAAAISVLGSEDG
jgi:dihydrofolate synthase/folylpolyglutamate synthase